MSVVTEFGVEVVNLPTQDVAVQVVLPKDATQVRIQARSSVDLKLSRSDGANFFTIKSGTVLYLERMAGIQKLWLECGTDDVNVEILWQR